MSRRRRTQRSSRSQRSERALEEALSGAVVKGAIEGARREREAAIADVSRSLLNGDVAEASRLVAEHGKAALSLIAAAAREVWPLKWRTALGPLILRTMKDAEMLTDAGPIRLGFDLANPRLASYFDGYMTELSGSVTETTREQVTRAVQEGLEAGEDIPTISKRIGALSDEIGPSRANLIARTETLKASKAASEIQARESGVVKSKTWVTAHDSRVRPEHRVLDGMTVKLDGVFSNGESYPSSPRCRCVLTYEIDHEALAKLGAVA